MQVDQASSRDELAIEAANVDCPIEEGKPALSVPRLAQRRQIQKVVGQALWVYSRACLSLDTSVRDLAAAALQFGRPQQF